MKGRERLIAALDEPSARAALDLVDRLSGHVGMFKVGKQLFTREGPGFVRELVGRGERVFLDLKFHDIPNTIAAAVAASVDLGVTLVDVHAAGGRKMIEAAARAVDGSETRLLGVTVLTSLDDDALAEIGMAGTVETTVSTLARLARDSGAAGVVASPREIQRLRESCGDDFLIVTPGVRPAGASHDDQARVASPGEAIALGADYLVMGRPIARAADPASAADAAAAEIDEATAR